MKIFNKLSIMSLIVFNCSLFFSSAVLSQQYVIRIGSGHPTAVTYVNVFDTYFVPEITKRAKEKGYNVRFVTAWGGSVAKVDNVSEAVQSGALDIGIPMPTFEGSRLQLLNFSNYLPFGTTDYNIIEKVAKRMVNEVPILKESLRKSLNVELLGLIPGENYGMNLKTPVTSVDDIRGRRIGASFTTAIWAEVVGAVPVGISIGEAYQAYATGLVDGGIIFISMIPPFRLDEVAKYWWKTDFGITLTVAVLMNRDTRIRLPKDLLTIIDQVANETISKVTEASSSREIQSLAHISKSMKTITLSDQDKRKWAEATKDSAAKVVKELNSRGLPGALVFQSYIKFLSEAGHKFPIEYSF